MTVRMKTVLVLMMLAAGTGGARAQEPAPAGRRGAEPGRQGAARPAPQPAPLFFRMTWKEVPAAVPATQAVVASPDLALTVYGPAP